MGVRLIRLVILNGTFVVLQALAFDGLLFDPFSLDWDNLTAPKVDIGGCEVVEAFVIEHTFTHASHTPIIPLLNIKSGQTRPANQPKIGQRWQRDVTQ